MTTKLELIRDFAAVAHEGQQRRYSPDPYIIHPEKVMRTCAQVTSEECILYAALLHDVIEDTVVTKEQLQTFLYSNVDPGTADCTLQVVIELTDVYTKENYPQWNRHKRKEKEAERLGKVSGMAQTIKCADIIDNCQDITEHDPDFAPKYLKECSEILDKMKEADPKLYKVAREVIKEEKGKLGKAGKPDV